MKPKEHRTVTHVFSVHTGNTSDDFLAFRARALETRNRLDRDLASNSPIDELVIDFAGVEAMTNSYADELIGKFYVALAAGDAGVSTVGLAGLNEETRDAITVCLERRKLTAVDADRGTLLGQVKAIDETYSCALQLGEFRASDIAEQMDISLTNANNRLKRLAEAGAVHRSSSSPEHGGKEFTYRVSKYEAHATR